MTRIRSTRPRSPRQVLLCAYARAICYVLLLFLAAHVSAYLVRSVVHPLVTLHRLRAEKETWARKVTEKKARIRGMREQKRWWGSPAGEDELAHRLGLVRPGEHTVMTTPPPAPKAEAPAVQHASLTEISPTLRMTVLTLLTCLLVYGALLFRRRRLLKARQEEVGVLTPRKQLPHRRGPAPAREER